MHTTISGKVLAQDGLSRAPLVLPSGFARPLWLLLTVTQYHGIDKVVHCGVDAGDLDINTTPVPSAKRLVCVGRLCEQKGQ